MAPSCEKKSKQQKYTHLQHLSRSLWQEVSQNVLSGCEVLIVYDQTLLILWSEEFTHLKPEIKSRKRFYNFIKHWKLEGGATFAHVADLLLEHVVAVLVDVRPQEVLEAVVDLQPGRHHGHPLPHSVTLQTEENTVRPSTTAGTPLCTTTSVLILLQQQCNNLHVLQVLDALDHFFFLSVCDALRCPLSQSPPPSRRALVVLVFAVWITEGKKKLTPHSTSAHLCQASVCFLINNVLIYPPFYPFLLHFFFCYL